MIEYVSNRDDRIAIVRTVLLYSLRISIVISLHQSSDLYSLARTSVPASRYWSTERMVQSSQLIGTGHATICLYSEHIKDITSVR